MMTSTNGSGLKPSSSSLTALHANAARNAQTSAVDDPNTASVSQANQQAALLAPPQDTVSLSTGPTPEEQAAEKKAAKKEDQNKLLLWGGGSLMAAAVLAGAVALVRKGGGNKGTKGLENTGQQLSDAAGTAAKHTLEELKALAKADQWGDFASAVKEHAKAGMAGEELNALVGLVHSAKGGGSSKRATLLGQMLKHTEPNDWGNLDADTAAKVMKSWGNDPQHSSGSPLAQKQFEAFEAMSASTQSQRSTLKDMRTHAQQAAALASHAGLEDEALAPLQTLAHALNGADGQVNLVHHLHNHRPVFIAPATSAEGMSRGELLEAVHDQLSSLHALATGHQLPDGIRNNHTAVKETYAQWRQGMDELLEAYGALEGSTANQTNALKQAVLNATSCYRTDIDGLATRNFDRLRQRAHLHPATDAALRDTPTATARPRGGTPTPVGGSHGLPPLPRLNLTAPALTHPSVPSFPVNSSGNNTAFVNAFVAHVVPSSGTSPTSAFSRGYSQLRSYFVNEMNIATPSALQLPAATTLSGEQGAALAHGFATQLKAVPTGHYLHRLPAEQQLHVLAFTNAVRDRLTADQHAPFDRHTLQSCMAGLGNAFRQPDAATRQPIIDATVQQHIVEELAERYRNLGGTAAQFTQALSSHGGFSLQGAPYRDAILNNPSWNAHVGLGQFDVGGIMGHVRVADQLRALQGEANGTHTNRAAMLTAWDTAVQTHSRGLGHFASGQQVQELHQLFMEGLPKLAGSGICTPPSLAYSETQLLSHMVPASINTAMTGNTSSWGAHAAAIAAEQGKLTTLAQLQLGNGGQLLAQARNTSNELSEAQLATRLNQAARLLASVQEEHSNDNWLVTTFGMGFGRVNEEAREAAIQRTLQTFQQAGYGANESLNSITIEQLVRNAYGV